MRTIRVQATRPHDILIDDGLLDRCGAEIASLIRPARLALITDARLDVLLAARVERSLTQAGFEVYKHVIPLNKPPKALSTLDDILTFLGANQFLRSDPLVWLGGGSVGDVSGLAAALYGLGMYAVQIPTTLVAAMEMTVGGRHAVDLPSGRNLAGAVAAPSLSLCDTRALSTLPDRLSRDGAAEMLKYALLGSEPLLQMLMAGRITRELDVALELCIRIKMEQVRGQETDPASWQLLRMGSTVGRAIEARSFGKVTHGDALGVGLLTMAKAAPVMIRGCEGCADRVQAALTAQGMSGECRFGRGELLTAIAAGRKREERYLTLAVPERVGVCTLKRVTMDGLADWLAAGGIGE